MSDEFDRNWLEIVTQLPWIEATYALIGLTRLGERPTTVERLAAALDRPEEEAIRLAWEASRVRPDAKGRIRLGAPFGGSGGPSRRTLYVGDRQLPVSGCAPDLLPAAAVLDVPFRVEDTCPVTGAPIRIAFVPGGVERVDPPQAVVAIVSPEVASEYREAEIEQVNQNLCSQQPFFASAAAAQGWLAAHPGGRVFPVQELANRPFFTHARDTWRPRILANAA
jgi:Alkylmercury lyase